VSGCEQHEIWGEWRLKMGYESGENDVISKIKSIKLHLELGDLEFIRGD
jgi:hypothetical protein